MTNVPEAITARLREIEGNLSSARQIQQMDAAQVARLDQQSAELAAGIANRRRAIQDWKLQRDALRYAVDAIEGRVVHGGTVEIPAAEPFVERVVVQSPPPWTESRTARKPPRQPRRQLKEDTASPKETVYEAIRRLGGPATAAQITEEAGLRPRAVAGVLGTLKKQGRVNRTDDGLWGPAHQ